LALSNWTRALLASAIAVSSIIGSALAANAVTNPADNPHPITVTGDDGNTYHDGADTLPGYDDEECTYIPGAWFDFANNRVRYADGQSIPWTEWDRASGYNDWLAAQSSSNSNNEVNSTDNSSTSTGGTNKSKKSSTKTEAIETTTDETAVTTEITAPLDGQPIALASSAGEQITSNPGRETGLAILGTLLLAGVIVTSGSSIRDRFARKEKA
jgi:hypothetical protein